MTGSANARPGPLGALFADLKSGALSRRQFTARALALGATMPVISMALRAQAVAALPGRHVGFGLAAQDGAAARPTAGMDGKTRGEGGELKLLMWQAPSMMSPHVSNGDKDYIAACPVLEPLMSYLPDGTLLPTLITEVPTVENGGLAEDLKSVTYTLLPDVTWSDGEPLTADDVSFTYDWIMNPANASVSSGVYSVIESIEVVDPLTVKVNFAEPNANWFEPHAGTTLGFVYPKHVLDVEDGRAAHDAFLQKPTGTGPYVVESFVPNDQIIFVANENYREADKPFFARINMKGGGDAASAARAVLQTGEYDWAWNIQVEPDILAQLEQGGKGKMIVSPGTSVERLHFQFADPNTEVDGQRSEMSTKNPVLSDLAVRQALNLSAPRDVISNQLYAGELEPPTANILAGIGAMDSPNTSWEFNLDKAKQLLDEAGWLQNGDVRAKDGVELKLVFSTTINSVRQKTQAILKQTMEELGVQVELSKVDAGVFFDSSAGNDQNTGHAYWDIYMFTNNTKTPIPVVYMISWYAGADNENVAQKSNDWSGQNTQRYVNPEYDKLFDAVRLETDLAKAAELFIQMNDILINDVAVVPLVNRASGKEASSLTLREENMASSDFEYNLWNIANWNRVDA